MNFQKSSKYQNFYKIKIESKNYKTFLDIEFLLGYLNIDCEFEVQKKF